MRLATEQARPVAAVIDGVEYDLADAPAELLEELAQLQGGPAHKVTVKPLDGELEVERPAAHTYELRELWRRAAHDADTSAVIARMIERGMAPIDGGATGLQASSYMSNLPAEGAYVMDNGAFARETERNDMPLEQKPVTLGGAPIDLRIPNIGIMTGVRLAVKGTLNISGSGPVTTQYGWPWNLLKRITVNLQGQTGLISSEGLDIRARRQRVYRNPREEISTAPGIDATNTQTYGVGNPAPGTISNGSYAVTLMYDIPIVHDAFTLTGAIYAQSDAVYLNWRIQPAQVSELFTVAAGGAVAFTGTISTMLTFFDIPFDPRTGKQLLPDLRWLHSVISSDKPFSNTGPVVSELIRTAGQLVCVGIYYDNGGAAQIDTLALDEMSFEYGGNRRPRVYAPVEMLLEKNVQDYNGRIRPGWAFFDFEVDNPDRETVYPKGVTELKIVGKVPVGTTVNANAKVHTFGETLFSGAIGG